MNIFSQDSKVKFSDLYEREGLLQLNIIFNNFLKDVDYDLFYNFLQLKKNSQNFSKVEKSNILILVSQVLEDFISELFNIENENEALQLKHNELSIIYQVKKRVIQRDISRKYNCDDIKNIDGMELLKKFKLSYSNVSSLELNIAKLINENLLNEELRLYCAWALFDDKGIELHKNGSLFNLPKRIDCDNLINVEDYKFEGIDCRKFSDNKITDRDGFKLSDTGYNLNKTLGEANYCIFCHNQDKDSCSIGLRNKEYKTFKSNDLDVQLFGCPLEEKISESNFLKSKGFSIAALAMIVIDNPMVAATGHRICNDCMKSCIYQKQDAVDIPQIETRIVKDVLNLPYGFEIYSLLTRWNPINLERCVEKALTGKRILVAGLGPAGFTLSHHLLNEGHLVIAIDGLKIEPLDKEISGIDLEGNRYPFKPIKNINDIYDNLDIRPMYGFGGVAEYGITIRWDKNYLKVIRLLLERRNNFQMFGGIRLGSAIDCYDALSDMSFDHVSLCLGAGWPNIVDIKNNYIKGVRSASDFLMALQLSGADKENLLTNLQIRLPVIVVGSGLTAVDTACEALAYYVLQVNKFAKRYNILCNQFSKENVEKDWNEEDKLIAVEFMNHYEDIKRAKNNKDKIISLLRKWGGAKLLYRKKIKDSPAYRLNHKELEKAFEEGIEFIEDAVPLEAVSDQFSHIKSLKIKKNNNLYEIKVKTLLFAIGTSPNKAPAYEDKLKFEVENNTFKTVDMNGNVLDAKFFPKANNIGFFASKNDQGKMVSFFGDLHTAFSGSVVKAMASAKKGYPMINDALKKVNKEEHYEECQLQIRSSNKDFLKKVSKEFTVKVNKVSCLSDYAVELVVSAPILARKTEIGHIFRLHNYHYYSQQVKDNLMIMENVAVTVF